MSLLDFLGLGSKDSRRPRRAGLRLEGRVLDEPRRAFSRQAIGVRVGLLAVLTTLALVAFPNVSVYDGTALPGEVWHSEDVEAPFDFSIRLDAESIAARRDSVARVEPPIFAEATSALSQTLARLDSVDARLDSAFVSYMTWQSARARAQAATAVLAATPGADDEAVRRLAEVARQDSARYAAEQAALRPSMSDRAWRLLLRSGVSVSQGREAPPMLSDQLLSQAAQLARETLARGVADVPRDSLRAPTLRVRNLDPAVRSEQEIRSTEVLTVNEALALARQALFVSYPGRPDTVAVGASFFRAALEPSLAYQAEATQRQIRERQELVPTTRGRVRQGFTIIRRGDVITPEIYEQLRSLELEERDRSGVSWVRTVLGRFVLVASALLLYFLYLYILRPAIFDDNRRMILVGLLVGLVLVGYWIAGVFGGAAAYAVPVSLATILLTIVFDSRVGSFSAIILASLGGLALGFDFEFTFATVVVGVLAVFSVRDVKNRSQLLASAGLVVTAYAIVLGGYALLRADPFSPRFAAELVAIAVHALLVLLAAPLLWGIERTFHVTTDMTLLELSDTNRPLLKELSLRAPGTFNHVLQVANLAEAAADAIGANALRTRVGALYHDIGKMLKPEYFIENQQPGENPHERLKPSMSALVIAAHVKDGLELGRENSLPRVVLDFIATHHGTSLMEFFYRKAQETAGPEGNVDEAEFRYPGPRPVTNEQAIVMLADSVEAASRSLDKPTPRRLQSLIDGIFASRVADGQLDRSSLTFADLARIKETFHSLLCGVYHFRVKYPDQDGATETPPPASAPEPEPTEIDSERPTSEERSTLG